MRLILALLLVTTILSGQRTLFMLPGEKAGEIGAMYSPSNLATVGIWGAYNGPFRAELSVDKLTDFFSDATIYGLRLDLPILKQSDNLPINIIGDAGINRSQGEGFGSTTYSGSAIVSHQVRNNNAVISPYGSAGYFKFDGGGEFKWTIGADALFGKALLGVEYERIGGLGTTYIRVGYRFGGKKKVESNISASEDMLPSTNETVTNQEDEDAARLQRELAQADSLNQELAKADRMKQAREAEKQRQLEAEQERQRQLEAERLEQERIDREKEEEIRRQQAEMERLRREQEAILNRQNEEKEQDKNQSMSADESTNPSPPAVPTNQSIQPSAPVIPDGPFFSVQFFASSYSDKQFDDLSWLSSIIIEKVEDRNLYRYKAGLYGSRYEAERVAEQLKNSGYPGAFVKEEE